MAEQVVLAEFTVGTSGVDAGVARVGVASEVGARQLGSFGRQANAAAGFTDVLTKRLFNLRLAASALLGAFTLAGAIIAVVSFVKEIVTATDAFKNFISWFEDMKKSLIEGETVFQRTTRHIQELTKAVGGADPVTQLMGQIEEARAAISGLVLERNKLIGKSGVEEAFASIDRTIFALFTRIDELTVKLAQARGVAVTVSAEATAALVAFQALPARALPEVFIPGELNKAQVAQLQMLENSLEPIRQLAQEVGHLGAALGEIPPTLMQIHDNAMVSAEGIRENAFAAQALNVTMQALGTAIIAAFLGGGEGRKNLFKDIMRQVAAAMIVKGLEYTAYGIAASTGIGALSLQGTPAQFFTAAGKFFAVGTAAALVSGSGGGGGGGGGGGSSARTFEQPAAQQAGPTIIINVEGSIIAPKSIEELERDITAMVRKGMSDNMLLTGAVAG